MQSKDAGAEGEDAALAHLKRAGLKLIQRNYRCRAGEIDLVMLDGKTLALVEVRYRSSSEFGGPAASVTWRKQRRIITAARHLMMMRAELRNFPARFDVVAISSGLRGPEVEWIKAAFAM